MYRLDDTCRTCRDTCYHGRLSRAGRRREGHAGSLGARHLPAVSRLLPAPYGAYYGNYRAYRPYYRGYSGYRPYGYGYRVYPYTYGYRAYPRYGGYYGRPGFVGFGVW